ncbi:hypothetical protein SRABI106_04398 [Rahnella aquatilis]|nr:hypothetical protein SRABI106_04398 [Rahnella aquatilis]
MEKAKRIKTAQAVEKIPTQTRQRDKVTTVRISGPHTDQCHKQRDQRRCHQQNKPGGPVNRENTDQNEEGNNTCESDLRQITGIVILHIFDLFKNNAGPTASRFSLDPGRSQLLETIQHQLAHFLTDNTSANKAHLFTQPGDHSAQNKRQRH